MLKDKKNRGAIDEAWPVAILAALVVALWGFALSASDINKGYTFLPTDHVTSTKLNNLVDLASISPTFITAQAADLNLAGADSMVLYSVSGAGLRKATIDVITAQTWTNTSWINGTTNWPTPAPTAQVLGYANGNWTFISLTNLVWQHFNTGPFNFQYGFSTNIAHGLTNTPTIVNWVLQCVSAEAQNGFNVGDELSVHDVQIYRTNSATSGSPLFAPAFACGANSSNVWIHCATNSDINLFPSGAGGYVTVGTNYLGNSVRITNSNWKLKCDARYWP